MPFRLALVGIALGLSLAAGCAPPKLDESRAYKLETGGAEVMDLPAVSKAQKVTIDFTSSASDVTVYLIKDFTGKDGLDTMPSKAQILESKTGKSGNFSVDVPANTATRVVVRGANANTDVTLKVTNTK
jgi:hypothetical protein